MLLDLSVNSILFRSSYRMYVSFTSVSPAFFLALWTRFSPEFLQPTLAHFFVKVLSDKGILLRNYTQNIDTLEREAGMSGDAVIECHGSFAGARCIECRASYPIESVKGIYMYHFPAFFSSSVISPIFFTTSDCIYSKIIFLYALILQLHCRINYEWTDLPLFHSILRWTGETEYCIFWVIWVVFYFLLFPLFI